MNHADVVEVLTRNATDVASLLNTISDNEERELLEEHFQRILQRELLDGARRRGEAAKIVDIVTRAELDQELVPLAPVYDLRARISRSPW